MMNHNNVYYHEYLHLDKILDAQYPVSFEPGNEPAHDEMLFIMIHQAYELWFKQILFELDYVQSVFSKDTIDDNSEDLNLVRHRLHRIIKIFQLLAQQITILDTMTPLDFLDFRNLLIPASGFQSVQFRLIEARLGLKMDHRFNKDYYKRTNEGGFNEKDYRTINKIEDQESLLSLINKWLERMPFFEEELWTDFHSKYPNEKELHPFWSDYRSIYKNGLQERESNKILDFDYLFFEDRNGLKEEHLPAATSLSPAAMRAALFIMLYRDFPVFQTSYQILDSLIEVDNQMGNWRHKHIDMVRRMIGLRMGTGNTSGRGYLEGALAGHYIFKDLSGLATFLIERKNLPKIPDSVIQKLSFSM